MQPGFAQGNITTQNLNPATGVPTAGSFVALPLTQDYATAVIQVTGVYTGALSVQASVDGVNWVTLGGSQALTNVNTAAQSATIPSAAVGIYQLDVAGFQAVRVSGLAAVTGTAVVSIVGSNKIGMVGIDTPLSIAGGSLAANQSVNVAQNAGVAPTLNAGAVAAGTPRVVLTNDNSSTATVTPAVGTAHTLTAAATTNATSVKGTAGSLLELTADNFTASIKYLKLYNKATAPTVGTDVPVLTIPIPANGFVAVPFGTIGKRFATGIGYALTGAQAVADTTALAAGDVHVGLSYI